MLYVSFLYVLVNSWWVIAKQNFHWNVQMCEIVKTIEHNEQIKSFMQRVLSQIWMCNTLVHMQSHDLARTKNADKAKST
jgi:hypothetical protein